MKTIGGPVRLLTRHFFRRFLDNDLLSPVEDLHETVATLLAGLARTGVLLTPRATDPQTPAVAGVAKPNAIGWARSRRPLSGLSSARASDVP